MANLTLTTWIPKEVQDCDNDNGNNNNIVCDLVDGVYVIWI